MFLLYRFRSTCVANCGKQFTEKHNLTRYMKTHVQSSQTYPGNISRKEISRPDTKKRHEESHNYWKFWDIWICFLMQTPTGLFMKDYFSTLALHRTYKYPLRPLYPFLFLLASATI